MTLKEPALGKQYISPIRLFKQSDISFHGDINIPRIKKQLNAEFNFASSGIIEIDGYSYNKNDVFEELERPDFTERLFHHKRVWERKFVLSLLENNEFNVYELKDEIRKFENEKGFEEFFSPYFAIPFSYIARNFLNDHRFTDLADLMMFEDYLKPAEREEGLKPIRIFLDDDLRVLKNVNKETYSKVKPQIIHYTLPGWSHFFNNLPHEFYNDKNTIAFHLVNLTVYIQKSNKKDCRAISRELVGVNELPQELRQLILTNDSVYNGSGSGSGNYWWLGWVIFIVLKMLIGC